MDNNWRFWVAILPSVLVILLFIGVVIDDIYEISTCKSNSFWAPTGECCTQVGCAEK